MNDTLTYKIKRNKKKASAFPWIGRCYVPDSQKNQWRKTDIEILRPFIQLRVNIMVTNGEIMKHSASTQSTFDSRGDDCLKDVFLDPPPCSLKRDPSFKTYFEQVFEIQNYIVLPNKLMFCFRLSLDPWANDSDFLHDGNRHDAFTFLLRGIN